MAVVSRRSLHFVFKVADRTSTASFYRQILGMKVLRHEEFEEGCKASCNGPYDGKWSKSMVGYGPEDNHFVVELTYNYGIKHYAKGNDFQRICIYSNKAYQTVRQCNCIQKEGPDGSVIVEAPGGYAFRLYDREPAGNDPVQSITLAVSNLAQSINYWHNLLKMKIFSQTDRSVVLGYGDDQAKLELLQIPEPVDHAEAFGRIAFACPREELPEIQKTMTEEHQTILTPLVSLDTPGKATVEVVILADPDGHEICFVGDGAFRELSQVDPNADQLIDKAMADDKSVQWFADHGRKLQPE